LEEVCTWTKNESEQIIYIDRERCHETNLDAPKPYIKLNCHIRYVPGQTDGLIRLRYKNVRRKQSLKRLQPSVRARHLLLFYLLFCPTTARITKFPSVLTHI
jgi:hypothetical protein